jgi:membrane protein DedA with SNARE-associated domain
VLSVLFVLGLESVACAGSFHLVGGAARLPIATFLTGTLIGLSPAILALAGTGVLLRHALEVPSMRNMLAVLCVALLLLATAAAVRTVLLIRRFAPSVKSHRTRAEFG